MKRLLEKLEAAVHAEWQLTRLNVYWRLCGKEPIRFSCKNCGFTLKFAHPREALFAVLVHFNSDCPRSMMEGGRVQINAEFACDRLL